MFEIIKLARNNIGLAYSCTRDYSLWGSEFHQQSNKFILDNLNYRIYAYGVVEDGNPIGHAILVDSRPPLSFVDSNDSLYLNCIYVSPKNRKKNIGASLLERIEIDAQKEKKQAIFLNTIGMRWMNKDFFKKHGYSIVNEDEFDSTLMKSFKKDIEYRIIKDVPIFKSKINQLVINYNPFCPLMLYQYSQLAKTALNELKEIEILENKIEKAKKNKGPFLYGVYFNNLPILVNENKISEAIETIKSLQIKI
ncbi:MAG: hypothetical protein COX48_05500 [bacterium (Candidatus Stahlbacteria) CG23_combo_of_CG06-09_8_20_14_all_34_7]|nr:MAG: hypothetical protein COX48_05500 [bacterium (Candidatus Stahlbacteria) CG23_combo_of_CG06-09_8_20_14_all_34_7]